MYNPPCYSCKYALKRGNFRLCSKGLKGYKYIGKPVECNKFKPAKEKESKNDHTQNQN